HHRLHPPQPPHRNHRRRKPSRQIQASPLVLLPHHRHPHHALHLPHRRRRRLEHRLLHPLRHLSRALLRRTFCGTRSANHGRAGPRPPFQPRPHAHRRRRQARQVVLRPQAAPPHRHRPRVPG